MTDKTRRRRFSFSLRTLFIVTTLVGCALGYIGWQAEIVHRRNTLISELKQASSRRRPYLSVEEAETLGFASSPRLKMLKRVVRVPFWRRALGDQTYDYLIIPATMSQEWIDRADAAFPEANLQIETAKIPHTIRKTRYERKPPANPFANAKRD